MVADPQVRGGAVAQQPGVVWQLLQRVAVQGKRVIIPALLQARARVSADTNRNTTRPQLRSSTRRGAHLERLVAALAHLLPVNGLHALYASRRWIGRRFDQALRAAEGGLFRCCPW